MSNTSSSNEETGCEECCVKDAEIIQLRQAISEKDSLIKEKDSLITKVTSRLSKDCREIDLLSNDLTRLNITLILDPKSELPLDEEQEDDVTSTEGRSTFCKKYKDNKGTCPLCDVHLVETKQVVSSYLINKPKFWIRGGDLRHDVDNEYDISKSDYFRWFIYLITDTKCDLQYVGSTTNLLSRWAHHKFSCNNKKASTGLSRHFIEGCPADEGEDRKKLKYLEITIIDKYDVKKSKLDEAKHKKAAGCRCRECLELEEREHKWQKTLGTCFGKPGLNDLRDVNMVLKH